MTAPLRDSFAHDGVVLVRDAVASDWLARLDLIVDRIAATPGRWATDTGDQAGRGRSVDERYLWRDDATVRSFALESGIAGLVSEAMDCRTLRFYYDHWFLKERGPLTATPWHQDAPYWPFSGRQIASAWLALTDVDEGSSALEIVKGSHRWNKQYRPTRFVPSDGKDDWINNSGADGEEMPDIDANRDSYDIFHEPMHRGDVLIFSAWCVHAAPANTTSTRRAAVSTRWLGDDVLWRPHAGADPTVGRDDVALAPGDQVTDDDRFPIAWKKS